MLHKCFYMGRNKTLEDCVCSGCRCCLLSTPTCCTAVMAVRRQADEVQRWLWCRHMTRRSLCGQNHKPQKTLLVPSRGVEEVLTYWSDFFCFSLWNRSETSSVVLWFWTSRMSLSLSSVSPGCQIGLGETSDLRTSGLPTPSVRFGWCRAVKSG